MNIDIITTAGDTFTHEESRLLALLIYKRFGYDHRRACVAWNRLLDNDCSSAEYLDLVDGFVVEECLFDALARLRTQR